MSDVVIKVENLSKQYRLGQVGTGTLTRDLQRWYSRLRGKEDPTIKIGSENILSSRHYKINNPNNSDYVWALSEINFDVKQGDVLGIIGKNGAGKSTLLKILSQVTSPTSGLVKVKGRIASLLEVGTGFNQELTGRENIYLNGSILGMTKKEIRGKFDEIVDFSGVENYIDTPVKRYSSGMYVRLAFAVAAYLEPEILIIDEVLAVGDAEFQSKCLGKIEDVSQKEGRTVLFVSHNMGTIKRLCTRGILIVNGVIKYIDHDINEVVKEYIDNVIPVEPSINLKNRTDRIGSREILIESMKLVNSSENSIIELGNPISLLIKYYSNSEGLRAKFLISINTMDNICILFLDSSTIECFPTVLKASGTIKIELSSDFALPSGKYYINIAAFANGIMADYIQHCLIFDVADGLFFKTGKNPVGKSICFIKQNWEVIDD